MSDAKRFTIEIPAGAGHQEFNSLFESIEVSKGHRTFGICIAADMMRREIPAVDMPKTAWNKHLEREFVRISSRVRPVLVTRANAKCDDLDMGRTANFFERAFHDLHWIGLTPDRVTRYVSKTIIFDVVLSEVLGGARQIAVLKGVMFNEDEVMQEIKRISEERLTELR